MSPYRTPANPPRQWWAVAQQSPFLPHFVLGRYGDSWLSRLRALFAAWRYVRSHPFGEARVIFASSVLVEER